MRKEAKMLVEKAVASLILCIEHFNRPWNRGRIEAVLFFLDHSFEMLLKAAIVHKGGVIREKGAKQTIGFDSCVRKAVSDAEIKYLSEEQALTIQNINGLRDAAYHHFVDLSEKHLYLHAQAGITLFKDILENVFHKELVTELPDRVLPISTDPPTDINLLFSEEIEAIKDLLKPGTRRKIEAKSKLRAIAILDGTINGERVQPSESELNKICSGLKAGKSWEEIFPGVASINLDSDGTGPTINLRITKMEGVPIHLVKEGTPGARVVAIKRVDELGYYSLGRDKIAKHLRLSGPKTTALIWYTKIKSNPEFFKLIKVDQSRFPRYSSKGLQHLQNALANLLIDDVWEEYKKKKITIKKSEHSYIKVLLFSFAVVPLLRAYCADGQSWPVSPPRCTSPARPSPPPRWPRF